MKSKITATENGGGAPGDPRFKMYNVTELAAKMEVPRKYITAIKQNGAPFYEGKTRPKWVRKWLKRKAHEEAHKRSLEP